MQTKISPNPIGPTVLIAEDDPDQSDMLKDTLEQEGYNVETVFDGDNAYAKLLEHDYELVILDIRMPGLNGASVLRAYRAHHKARHVPIVIVSAFATEEDMRSYRKDGADASLAKPYEMHELLELITQFVPKGVV